MPATQGTGTQANFVKSGAVPVLLRPASFILLPPRAKAAQAWPRPRRTVPLDAPRLALGPRALCAMAPAPSMPIKAAATRLVSELLRGCQPPEREIADPFPHHWVLEVEVEHLLRSLRQRTVQDEAYTLDIRDRRGVPTVRVRSPTPWGALHALSTLRNLLEVEHSQNGEVRVYVQPCTVEDRPAHAHRALIVDSTQESARMLEPAAAGVGAAADGSRTGTEQLVKLFQWVDLGANLKFNVLHWVVLGRGEERFAHLVELLRVVASYAARRGLQLMPHVHLDAVPPADRPVFLRRLSAVLQGTSPLIYLGDSSDAVHLPSTHAAVLHNHKNRQARARLYEYDFHSWSGKSPFDETLLRFGQMNTELSFLKLLQLREMAVKGGPALRGGGLEAPADVLPLLQVAAFLWCPDTMIIDPKDPTAVRAMQSVFVNAGLPVRQRHMIEVENPRMQIIHSNRKTEKPSQSSAHPKTPPDATSAPG